MTVLASLPGLCLVPVLCALLDESPRFLLLRSREEAQAAVNLIADKNGQPVPAGRLQGLKNPEALRDVSDLAGNMFSPKVIASLFAPSRRSMTITIFVIYAMLNFGAYSNFMWLLKYLERTKKSHLSQYALFGMFGGKALGIAVGVAVIDGPGRIALITPGFVLAALFTVVMVDPFQVSHASLEAVALISLHWCVASGLERPSSHRSNSSQLLWRRVGVVFLQHLRSRGIPLRHTQRRQRTDCRHRASRRCGLWVWGSFLDGFECVSPLLPQLFGLYSRGRVLSPAQEGYGGAASVR